MSFSGLQPFGKVKESQTRFSGYCSMPCQPVDHQEFMSSGIQGQFRVSRFEKLRLDLGLFELLVRFRV